MEDENTSGPIENLLPKKRSIIFRGIMWGMIGGVTAGLVFGLIYGSFDTFSTASHFPPPAYLEYLVNLFFGLIFDVVVVLGLPLGLVIGLSTGILAAIFGHHCPKLSMWLAFSWFGAIASFELGVFLFYGWDAYIPLLAITLISFGASWIAYRSTFQEIKKGVPKEVSQAYAFLCSSSHAFLIFVMLCPYFFLSNMST